jgi:hypothetical protein
MIPSNKSPPSPIRRIQTQEGCMSVTKIPTTAAGVSAALHDLMASQGINPVPAGFDAEGALVYREEGSSQSSIKPLLTLSELASSNPVPPIPCADDEETPRAPLPPGIPLAEATTIAGVRRQIQGIFDTAIVKKAEGLRQPKQFLVHTPLPPQAIMDKILDRQSFDAFIMDVGDAIFCEIRDPAERMLRGVRHLLSASENLAALRWFTASAMVAELAAAHAETIARSRGESPASHDFALASATRAAEGWNGSFLERADWNAIRFRLDRGIYHAYRARQQTDVGHRLYRRSIKWARLNGSNDRAAADALRLASMLLEKEPLQMEQWAYLAILLRSVQSQQHRLQWSEQAQEDLKRLSLAAEEAALGA